MYYKIETVYENIKSLRPYFLSLREIETNVSLDLKIPITWKYDNIAETYKMVNFKFQDKNEKTILLSLIHPSTQDGYDIILECAKNVIKYNKEEEEKQKLFQEKINELKLLFQNESLDKLKKITLIENGQEDSTRIGLVEEGNEKR